ncbi:hypothetical protein M433DRAFT_147366 [Acidomyces richmondensis BFW]|nr:hypothetical protein M433DRAFT_147366 [Acidomyces richmondensis BFW]
MSSQIASKNLYELLGNDPELDPDREPEPPTKVVDKPVQRSGKRNAGADVPGKDAPRPVGGGRAGSMNNRADRRDDGLRHDRPSDRPREPREYRDGGYRGRGSRGGRGYGGRGGRPHRDDRHSRSGIGDHEKQAEKGWGENTGTGEWSDEKAGEAIAEAEAKDEPGLTADTTSADPAFSNGPDAPTGEDDVASAEPETKTKSYDQWLAEQAEKRLALSGGNLAPRKANEGSKQKFPEGTAFQRNPDDENFIAGSGGKQRKQKEKQEKDLIVVEGQYYAPIEQDRGSRGGRGGGRGRGRDGGDRGARGGGRGRGRGEGEYRGLPRGEHRGGARGGLNTNDERAFPSLGGK